MLELRVDDEDVQGNIPDKYYRILKSLNVVEEENRVQTIIKDVFYNLAMKVVVDSDPVVDSPVAEFIEELRDLPNLHFEK